MIKIEVMVFFMLVIDNENDRWYFSFLNLDSKC